MKKPPKGGCIIFLQLIFITIYLGKKSITVDLRKYWRKLVNACVNKIILVGTHKRDVINV